MKKKKKDITATKKKKKSPAEVKQKKRTLKEEYTAREKFASKLIKKLNRGGKKIAHDLNDDDSPTHVSRWVSTGSKLLDYICSNRRDGGLPLGRFVEIFGPPSIGKSHLALQLSKSTQKDGGVVNYIDTENAIDPYYLPELGINLKNFVYVSTNCTEEVFEEAEAAILFAKECREDVPFITVIWDSVANSAPKAIIEGNYGDRPIALNARLIASGITKIVSLITNENSLFVCLNQEKQDIMVKGGHPRTFTPGGSSIKYQSAIRIKLSSGHRILNEHKEVIGIHVTARTVKNKVAAPFREAKFEIHFGVGIKEHEQIYDVLREQSPYEFEDCDVAIPTTTAAWKNLTKTKKDGEVIFEKKFYRKDFGKIMEDPEYSDTIMRCLDFAMIRTSKSKPSKPVFDITSQDEVEAVIKHQQP